MKKLYSIILLSITGVGALMAQPTLTSTNFTYGIGDTQLYYVADTNSVIDPTVGANVIFNYNGLRGYGMSQNQYIINPTTTTYTGDFPSADYADTSDALATNTRYAELINTDSLINLGFVTNVQGYGDVIARYNGNPEIAMKFPFDYGDNYNDLYGGTFTLLTQNTPGNGNVTVNADAWGQLQLPFGVVIDSVLRVRTVEHVVTDTVQIPLPPITILPITIDAEYINYYKPSLSKFPILSYIAGSIKQNSLILDSNKTFISQYALPGVGISDIENNLVGMNLYPNPSNSGNVLLSIELDKKSTLKVEVMNKLGQFVKPVFNGEGFTGVNKINIVTNDLASGIYFVNTYVNGLAVTKELVIQ